MSTLTQSPACQALVRHRDTHRDLDIRALFDGAWGFAASADTSDAGIDRAAARAVDIARAGAAIGAQRLGEIPTDRYVDTFATPLERDPRNRYAGAREFRRDLEHLDEVGVEDRPELKNWQKRKSQSARKVLYYAALAMIPVAILLLMFLVARRG